MRLFSEKGGAFVLVLVVLAVLTILGGTLLNISLSETKQVVHQDKRMQAFYLARSGADAISTHIIRNPTAAESLVNAPKSNSNSQFSNGTFEVEVKPGTSSQGVVVEGTGHVGNVSNSVKVEMTRLNAGDIFDKAIYSDQDLDITGMNVNGEVQSGENISWSENGSNEYDGTAYPNSKLYIELADWPSCTAHNPADIVVKNREETITQSYKFSSISVEQNGVLRLDAGSSVLKLEVDDLTIDNCLEITATGGGRVELYINNTMTVTTKGCINNLEPRNLIIYLADGSYLELQAGKIYNGYIIGPDATVEVQSAQSIINGAVICETLVKNENGNGANGMVNYVDINSTDILPSVVAYRVVRWTN